MSDTCSVCMYPCSDSSNECGLAVTKCNHRYHLSCFIKALAVSDNCAMCRRKLNLYEVLDEQMPNTHFVDDRPENLYEYVMFIGHKFMSIMVVIIFIRVMFITFND